jgi:cytochrome c-type biogenesis protein CcmH
MGGKVDGLLKPLVYAAAIVMLTAVVHAPSPVLAQERGEHIELPADLEARAQNLYVNLMCPICNGQTISQSHAPIAATMRTMVREQLLAEDSDDEIIDLMVASFGEAVLASPPKRGLSLAVWIIPPVGLLLGAGAVFLALRSMRRPAAAEPAMHLGTAGGDLTPYLQLVDDEMADDKPQTPDSKRE